MLISTPPPRFRGYVEDEAAKVRGSDEGAIQQVLAAEARERAFHVTSGGGGFVPSRAPLKSSVRHRTIRDSLAVTPHLYTARATCGCLRLAAARQAVSPELNLKERPMSTFKSRRNVVWRIASFYRCHHISSSTLDVMSTVSSSAAGSASW